MTITHSAVPDFLNDLQPRVAGDLRSDMVSRLLYSTDASIYQVLPHAVLIPKTIDDVHAAVELAARYRVPLLPRTGGSSLAGQSVNEALVIDMTRHLDQVLEVNVEERWARVQPGLVLDQFNRHLRPHGLQFGPDPASGNRAALGGIISNNATGAHSIVYGMAADHVRGMDVLLSDGSQATFAAKSTEQVLQFQTQQTLEAHIYRTVAGIAHDPAGRATIQSGTPRHWRRCGGYNLDRLTDGVSFLKPREPRFNLAELIAGAEGTLAVITELTLDLVPRPQKTALGMIHFADLREALRAVPLILEIEPSAVELLDNLGLTLCREVPEYARLLKTFVDGEPNCILVTEFYGTSDGELQAKLNRLSAHLRQHRVQFSTVTVALDAQRQADVWKVRKAGLGFLMSIKGDYKPIPFIEDAAVPVAHLGEYVLRLEQFCAELGTKMAYYAHASAGCLHIRPIINTKDATDIAKMPEILDFAVGLLGEYGGALSSEHGDGRSRSWLNERFFGRELYALYRQVKRAFDPHNLLNPGNVVDAGPMTENLRFGPAYQTIPLETYLDFSDDMGFHRAVEMCNGAGVCRKVSADTMCPSFQATREERDSTRGRANMLRAVLSGQLPPEELTGERLYGVMSLCVSCKACKAECPSSVDMGKIKTEFLAHYQAANGTPLRSRLLGNIATLSRLSSGPLAPAVNWTLSNRAVKWGMTRLLNIAPERTLPRFARQPFTTWFKRRQPREGKPLVLFNDTFTTYNEPNVAIAATEVLEAAGFALTLPGHHCCGRPALSKGLVERARAQAQGTLDKLFPLVEQGLQVVGLEPSCLSAIRDDYAFLLPGDSRVERVAAHTFTFEEFISQLATDDGLADLFTPQAGDLLLHGHCHQKALIGTKPSKTALGLLGYSVSEVDSGCCGMAGSFGYEAEHYPVSIKMAERRLLPAVRGVNKSTPVVAAGTSCRHQIVDGTGRTAQHSAEILRAALK